MTLSMRAALLFAAVLLPAASASSEAMPAALVGTWRITRILPTHNASCWDAAHARGLPGTTLQYADGSLRWKGGVYPIAEALTRTLTRRAYLDEYRVNLAELGVRAESVTEVDLQHDDADITGATTEVPGDTVVLASPTRIVVSACGVYYEAVRVRGSRAVPGRGVPGGL